MAEQRGSRRQTWTAYTLPEDTQVLPYRIRRRIPQSEDAAMCGRYAFYEHQELSERLTNVSLDTNFLENFRPTWNAAPSQSLPVIVEDRGKVEVRAMTWGLIPTWTKPGEKPKVAPINARAETVAEKPMFRSLVKHRRCLVPANGFYEWKRSPDGKQPHFVQPTKGQLM
ncbi:MAG: SOS response-associated peptidase, partial [Thermomicrobiales bacterium]